MNQARKAQFSIFAIFNLGCWILVSISVFYGSVAGAIGAETQPAKRVLMLFSESKFVPGNVLVEQAAREVLQQGARPIEFYAEYLDAGRFPEENHYRLFREYMHEKYAQRPPDLVIAFLARKFELAGQLPAELFPNVPVVFGALTEEEIPRSRLGSNVTGVVQRFDVQGALSTILKVQPETQRIVVIGGTAPLDQLYLARTEEASRLLSQRVDVEFWHTRPVAEMRRDVAALPPRTVIFFTTVFRDAAGETFFPEQVASLLAMLSTVPLYVLGDPMIGNGVVGGRVAHLEAVGQRAGELARQVLEGAAPASLPIEVRNHGVPMFDWRALKRWGISEARLPPGSIVRFRQPSMWEQYRWHIIGAALIITLQSALIIGLLTHRARRRRAESEVERQRRELAHVTRVATINEMTASVAHELNQPLGAILSNAEAAEMFLNAEPPALDEVRDILADIRKDDQRAGEVIRRMRALLRKQDIVKEPLKINEVAEEILNLLKIDAAERKVVIKFEPTADLAEIRGDRIHLQQVLLNLGLNAIEAMAATPVKERQLVIRTEPGSNGSVKIAVADSGPGIVDQQLSQLFEPFFTTKKDGLGMGLIIARTIVEAHGGRIWAENNPAGGATFYVTLPVSHPTHGLYSGR